MNLKTGADSNNNNTTADNGKMDGNRSSPHTSIGSPNHLIKDNGKASVGNNGGEADPRSTPSK